VVIDYRDACRAIDAQRLLSSAGIRAVYILDRVIAFSDDPMLTQWIVQRLDVPAADAERALALLEKHGLRETSGT
jgi:hypothetical protein